MPAVYDDQKEKTDKPSTSGQHDDLGVHPERREAEVDDLENLYNAESAPELKKGKSKAEDKEAAAIPDTASSDSEAPWDTEGLDPKKRKFSLNRRKAAASGGIVGILIGGSIGFFGFISGPLQFIHFAQNLQQFHFFDDNNFSDSRTGKLLRWARSQNTPEDRNLSRTGNKIAVHYEAKLRKQGIDFEYGGGGNTGRLSSITADTKTSAGKKFIASVEADNGIDLGSLKDPKGKIKLDLAVDSSEITNAGDRRKLIKGSVDALELNGVSGALSKRMLKARAAVDFHPLKNIARNADEKLRLKYGEYKKRVKEERNKSIKEGSKPPAELERNRTDDPDKPATDADAAEASKIDDGMSDLEATAKNTDIPMNERISGVKAKLGVGIGATAVVGTICGLQALGEASADLQESNIVQPLLRTGMSVITTGSQIMTGQGVNMDELGVLADSFYDEETKTSWSSAESIQSEWGNPGKGVPMQNSAKPGRDKPTFFKVIDTISRPLPCSVINSTLGGLALDIGGLALNFTGPVALVVNAGSEVAQQFALNAVMDDIVRWLAGEAVDIASAAGGTFGNYANFGAFLASNDTMKGKGGRPLTNGERLALKIDQQNQIKKEMKHKSMYARIFNPVEPNSLVAKTFLEDPNYYSARSTIASAVKLPITTTSMLGSAFKKLSPNSFAAQTTNYDYGVDQYGFSIEETNSTLVEDPYTNANYVENNLDLAQLNEDYGKKCLGTTIDPSTGKINYSQAPSYTELEKIRDTCTSTDADILRYRMFVADNVNLAALSCYEGIEEADCGELGAGSVASTDTVPAEGPSDIVAGDTSNLTCGAGTDAGVGDGYSKGELYKIRLCDVQGTTVNAQIAQNVDRLLNDAKAAGIPLGGSGFRTMQRQIELRSSNHCPDIYNAPSGSCGTPTAIPGHSNHQMGLAIDFTQNGSTLRSAHSGFAWMVANASKYGLKNLPSETWHWSVDGH